MGACHIALGEACLSTYLGYYGNFVLNCTNMYLSVQLQLYAPEGFYTSVLEFF